MKKYILQIILISSLSLTTVSASSWLDDGATVTTITPKEVNSSSTAVQTKTSAISLLEINTNEVTLGTGETVILIGGVYVKAEDPDSILDWAQGNGYVAKKDAHTENTVHVTTTAEESISVANAIAQLDDVTTAAPKYRQEMVTK